MSPEPESPKPSSDDAGAPEALVASASPHIRSPESIPRIMWTVSATLAPAAGWGVYVFGSRALWIMALSIATAVAAEAACQLLRRRPVTITDGSAFLTGLLVAFVLPVHVPWYVPVTASFFAIAAVKQAFGGLGCNIWNPALMGRAFVMAAWAALLTAGWKVPCYYQIDQEPEPQVDAVSAATRVDATTGPTPLTNAKEGLRAVNAEARKAVRKAKAEWGRELSFPISHDDATAALGRVQDEHSTGLSKLFFGQIGGCIGEVSALLLLLGGLVLIAFGYVRWQVPVFFIGTVAVLAWVLPTAIAGAKVAASPEAGSLVVQKETSFLVWFAGRPLFEMFAGGLFLGSFYMATDMVTSPVTRRGMVIFAVGCGVLTVLIRRYGGYPEGVCYAILVMNTARPLIDRHTKPRVFGQRATP